MPTRDYTILSDLLVGGANIEWEGARAHPRIV